MKHLIVVFVLVLNVDSLLAQNIESCGIDFQ